MNKEAQNLSMIFTDNLSKTKSLLSGFSTARVRENQQSDGIQKMVDKLNKISQSVDITTLYKNPLNLIEYEMQGEKSRHDPQMILAKLRKLQNRAEIHRADVQISQQSQQKEKQKSRHRRLPQKSNNFSSKQQLKESYMKIYRSYLKQKQVEAGKRERYEEDEEERGKYQVEDLGESHKGVRYFNVLRRHPKLLDFTVQKKREKEGILDRQLKTQRKQALSERIKKPLYMEEFSEQKEVQQQKQSRRYFENPQKVIQRQITKFYVKKNPGKLSQEAESNQRSLSLIRKQKEISFMIDENKISKEDKKRLQNRFNDLANQIAKSDRRKSLEGLMLPLLKQGPKGVDSEKQQVKRDLLKERKKLSIRLFPDSR